VLQDAVEVVEVDHEADAHEADAHEALAHEAEAHEADAQEALFQLASAFAAFAQLALSNTFAPVTGSVLLYWSSARFGLAHPGLYGGLSRRLLGENHQHADPEGDPAANLAFLRWR
jgi:hypothetical protein